MNPMLNNPIASMYGPNFLLFYLVVAVGALTVTVILIRGRPSQFSPRSIPMNPDPYEIAFLRGGVNEVIRVAVLSLLQRGVLEQRIGVKTGILKTTPPPTIVWNPFGPPTDGLSPLEKAVVTFCRSPKQPPEFFTGVLPGEFLRLCARYEVDLTANGLLTALGEKQSRTRVTLSIFLAVLALGGYKIWAALSTGHSNIGFLIVEMIAVFIAFGVVGNAPRATPSGKRYIRDLQIAYQKLKHPGVAVASAGVDPALLALAVFGVAALAGTPEAAYAAMFRQASGASTGGCGGNGGGGGCGGGGGGGCGGGGGGCGGCGGGG